MNSTYFFFIGASIVFSVLTYVLALAYILKNKQASPRSARFMLIGLGILAVGGLLSLLIVPLLMNFLTPAQFAMVSWISQFGNKIVFAIALAMFAKAAFVDRDPNREVSPNEFLPGDGVKAASHSNPFVTPDTE